jgi:hypothetical protein
LRVTRRQHAAASNGDAHILNTDDAAPVLSTNQQLPAHLQTLVREVLRTNTARGVHACVVAALTPDVLDVFDATTRTNALAGHTL